MKAAFKRPLTLSNRQVLAPRAPVCSRPAHGTARACCAPAAQTCCALPRALCPRRAPGQLPWAPFAARAHTPILAGMQPMHLEGMLLRAPSANP
eukprot:scaffold114803_cov69-Phaeocystis_antarctica.AAC.4